MFIKVIALLLIFYGLAFIIFANRRMRQFITCTIHRANIRNNMLKQKQPYGCGVLSVANALNQPQFATPERIAASKDSNTVFQLNTMIKDAGGVHFLEPAFFDGAASQLPLTHHYNGFKVKDTAANENDYFMPFILCVVCKPDSKLNHMIAGHLLTSGKLLILDSLIGEPFKTTFPDLQNHYHQVFGLYTFNKPLTNERLCLKINTDIV